MALNSSEIVVAGNGGVYVAAVATAYPATPTTAVSGSWTELGYLTEDGITVTPGQTAQNFPAWQAMLAVRTSITGRSLRVGWAFEQWNEVILPLALGGGAITGAGPYTYAPPTSGVPSEKALLLRWVDGTKAYDLKLYRTMAVDLAAFNLNKANMATLAVAFEVLQPTSGDAFNIMTDDPAFA